MGARSQELSVRGETQTPDDTALAWEPRRWFTPTIARVVSPPKPDRATATTAGGEVSIANIPGGLGAATFYVQALYVDGAQTAGWGISNAIEIVMQP